MSLPPALHSHNAILAATLLVGRLAAERLGVARDDPVTQIARRADVSRTYVYEVRDRVLAALDELAARGPGRPPREARADAPVDADTYAITIAVLRYRVDHPGAVVASGPRRAYSPAFRRFVLELHDTWPPARSLADFAEASEIPLDTLRDWSDADRRGLTPAPEPPPVAEIPADASPLVAQIAELFTAWQGSTREFLRAYARPLGLMPGVIRRVLVLLCLISPRRPRSLPGAARYRGSTQTLSPGAVLVTDGKQIDIHLSGSCTTRHLTWQAMVDQATGTNTAVVVTDEECAAGVIAAYEASRAFLGDDRPDAVLLDNKPCNDAAAIESAIAPTALVRTTLGRAENKAMIEGAFGKWEQFVGTIELDDSSPEALLRSAVHEIVRAYCAGADHAPRQELGGKSRLAYLGTYVRSPAQRRRDEHFLRTLRARHRRSSRSHESRASRRLLDAAFAQHACLRNKDPRGALRRYLAYCAPEAVRQALAIFAAKLEQGAIEHRHAHRYLRALVVNSQHEFELRRCEAELFELARTEKLGWMADLEQQLADIRHTATSPLQCTRRIAERAALGGLPIEGAFWTKHFCEQLDQNPALTHSICQYLTRLYEAPTERRLALIDLLAARTCALQ